MDEYERHRIQFENKATFLAWLFEYACQTAQYQGIEPKIAGKYLEYLVRQKLDDVLPTVRKVYEDNPDYARIPFPTPDFDSIPNLVRQEHMMGKKS
jgi:hypothetical protein